MLPGRRILKELLFLIQFISDLEIMSVCTDTGGVKWFVERLTLGIMRVLESLPGVTDVRFVARLPAEKRSLLSWEQKHGCLLPDDLRDFYLTTDGFSLSWSSKLEGEPVPLGHMFVSSVAKLQALHQSITSPPTNTPSLADVEQGGGGELDGDEGPGDRPCKPHFDSRSRIFELDPCNGIGKVCLVYQNCSRGVVGDQSEIWFLDRSYYWHYLTSSFSAYYRLMISHLGLPEWQYTFTPYGPGPQAKQWACLYQPLTFQQHPSMEVTLNKLDPSKAFQDPSKQPTPKKKAAGGMGGGGQRGVGRLSGGKR